jgi:hypothetical protein
LPVVCWIFSASCWVSFLIAEAVPTTSMPPMISRRRRRRRTMRRIARRLNISRSPDRSRQTQVTGHPTVTGARLGGVISIGPVYPMKGEM